MSWPLSFVKQKMPKAPKQYKPRRVKPKKRFTFNKTGRAKGYDYKWEKYRRRFLYHNPNCYTCPDKANTVDHILTHKGDRKIFEAVNNHMPLCKLCHNTITGKFDRHKIQDIEGKGKWINKMRETYRKTTKIKMLAKYP